MREDDLLNEERALLRKLLDNAPPETVKAIQDFVSKAQAGDPPTDHEVMILAADGPPGVRGSKQVRCDGCSKPVWIAPSTQQMIARRPPDAKPVHFMCNDCAKRRMPDDHGPLFVSDLAKRTAQ